MHSWWLTSTYPQRSRCHLVGSHLTSIFWLNSQVCWMLLSGSLLWFIEDSLHLIMVSSSYREPTRFGKIMESSCVGQRLQNVCLQIWIINYHWASLGLTPKEETSALLPIQNIVTALVLAWVNRKSILPHDRLSNKLEIINQINSQPLTSMSRDSAAHNHNFN